MSTLNTTAKGNDFEDRCLKIMERIISDGQLGHLGGMLKYIPKAKYYSNKRKKDITFDLAIEVWTPGASKYVSIYLIECKNYKRRVSVDKVNTFLYDLSEVGPANAKAIFITNSPLQEAAYNTADSAGMMVVQGESADDYRIILHKTNRKDVNREIPFVKDTVQEDILDEGAKLIIKLIDEQLLNAFQPILDLNRVAYGIDRLSKARIIEIANYQLKKINPKILSEGLIFGPSTMKKYMLETYGIEVYDFEGEEGMLGLCDLENNRIGISKSIISSPREFFVMCHEFGHFVLHQKLSIGQQQYNIFNDSSVSFRTGKYELKNSRNWIEWQANYFASSLIMPTAQFQARLWVTQDSMNLSRGKILLDDAPYNIGNFHKLVEKLAYRYSVSKTTIIYKLNEMGLINNKSRTKTVGQLIDQYSEGMMI